MTYTNGFKARLVQRMAGPESITATALARETGVSQATLSRWLKTARVEGMPNHDADPNTRPSKRSAEEKLRILLTASAKPDEELGAYLREVGVHAATLEQWRAAAASALGAPKRDAKSKKEKKRVQALERELRRKEKALAEMAALITLQKKVREIWGDGDDDTGTRSAT